ncbi:MAG: uroporphyrinogen decarboxylase family protein [Treponema sp.]|nr:uroporphyrinogen decarboxylase family protein [Treponema sp.]
MTSLERVLAALSGEAADRRALSLTLSLYGARLAGIAPHSYYRDPLLYLRGQEAAVARFDSDIVFAPFALALEGEAYGATLAWYDDAPPNVKRPLGSAREAVLVGPKGPAEAPGLAFIVESVRRLSSRFEGEKPVAAILTAPIDLPALVIGLDAWLDTLLFDKVLANELFDLGVAHFVAMSRACFAAGAAFVVSPVMLVNPKLLTRELIEGQALPTLARAFSAAGGPLVFHHGAIGIGSSLEFLRELPGVAGFVIDQRDDYASARAVLGPGRLILGGFSGPLMERCGPDTMRKLAKRALDAMGSDPAAILASTAADIPWDTPAETIDAVIGEVRRRGGEKG